MTEFEEKVSKFKKDRQDPTPAQEMIYLGGSSSCLSIMW